MHNWLIRPYKMPDYSAKVGIFVRMDKSKQYLPTIAFLYDFFGLT